MSFDIVTEHCCQVCILSMMFCRSDCRLCAWLVIAQSRKLNSMRWFDFTPTGQHGWKMIWKVFFTFDFRTNQHNSVLPTFPVPNWSEMCGTVDILTVLLLSPTWQNFDKQRETSSLFGNVFPNAAPMCGPWVTVGCLHKGPVIPLLIPFALFLLLTSVKRHPPYPITCCQWFGFVLAMCILA